MIPERLRSDDGSLTNKHRENRPLIGLMMADLTKNLLLSNPVKNLSTRSTSA